MSVFLYSQYPLEQAVFEQFVEISKRVEALLLEQPDNTVTTPIGGHGYFLAAGVLLASPNVGFDATPITNEDLFFARKPVDIEGMAYGDIFGIIQSTMEWLESPAFVTLDRPIGPLTPDQAKHVQKPEFSGKDYRLGSKHQYQHRPYYRDTVSVTVVNRGWFGTAETSINGTPVEFQLNEASLALLAGSALVSHIRMVLPMLSEFGKPSAFHILNSDELLDHLCYGTSFSPNTGAHSTQVEVTEGPEHRMEYVLNIPQYLVERARQLAAVA